MATIFKLIIEDDEGKTTVYPLSDGSVSIGRREGNTIRLMERNVSRRHARLLKNNGAVFIEDLDSYNGIRINGERIAGRYEVKEGDLLEIGDYHLALQRSEVADARPAGAQRDGWPQAGTLPDIQLPNEMTEGAARNNRDTLIDQPVPPTVPGAIAQTVERGALDQPLPPSQPLVKPPPRGETGGGGSLPPFPGPGGLAPPKSPMYGESSQATEAAPSGADASKLAVGPAYVSTVPRIVCVSSSYAGKEFALTRPELIIGRVEDNDIVIEHRSVSRNHAKILFDGRTHKIIDLQSANGILVNGEEYAMTDLRKGDLIELGHVRFRFIPADEAFVATEEEGREMREAGVEPPEAPKDPPTNGDAGAGLVAPAAPAEASLPAYDPSTAQTVTDTPLDALGMGDLAGPRIEATPVAASNAPTDKPMRATADERPTEIRNVPASGRPSAAAYSATVPDAPAPLPEPAPRAQTRAESVAEPPPEGPKKGLLVVIGALLLTAVVLAFMVLTGGGSAERQEALQKAFAAEDWKRVVELYEEDPSDFEDPKAVLPLYRKALSSQQMPVKAPPVAPPTSAVDLPPGDGEPDPDPLEPVEEPEPEPEVELPAGDADAKAAVTKRPRRRRAPKAKPKPRPKATNSGAAAKLASDGSRALMQGDLTTAERLLKRCLKADPTLASCHRTLGVLYAQKDDPQRSIQHYRKYVQLRPKAADANRVREMIRTAEQAVSGGGENSL